MTNNKTMEAAQKAEEAADELLCERIDASGLAEHDKIAAAIMATSVLYTKMLDRVASSCSEAEAVLAMSLFAATVSKPLSKLAEASGGGLHVVALGGDQA